MRKWVYLFAAAGAVLVLSLALPVGSAPGDPVVTFSAAGDYGSSAAARAVFDRIGQLDRDTHLALGDLSYGVTGAEQTWCDAVVQRVGAGFPFELIAGNHESNGQNGNINDFSACLPNQLPGLVGTYGRQYYVDVPAGAPLVRYVMISPGITFPDGAWSYAAGSARYSWTAQAIDGARTAGIPWVVVGLHKPCLSIGEYGCDPGSDLMNLLVARKVDLVLSGHEHLYQRSKQLGHGPGCIAITPGTYTSACVVDADDDLTKGAGTVMTTIGTGGVGLRDVHATDSELPYFAATSGANQNPTFGLLDLSATADGLTAAFVRTSGGTFTDTFTIRQAAPPNSPPSAAFTSSCTRLSCTFDAAASFDADGTIAAYAWNYGDGVTGGGVAPTHAYAAAGAYSVTLTVTDDDGGSDTITHAVTVSESSGGVTFASDAFSRTVSGGFGTAPVGGPWSLVGPSSSFSVSGGQGRMSVAAGAGRLAFLGSVSTNAVDLRTAISSDKSATGGGLYVSVVGRRVAGVGDYRAKVKVQSSGAVSLRIARANPSNTEIDIGNQLTVSGVSFSPGDRLNVRLEVSGTSPTTIRTKLWEGGAPEPAGWQLSTTDNTTGLQTAGSVGVWAYLSGSATNAPATVTVDDLVATAP